MAEQNKDTTTNKTNYLGIMFNCCGVYARIYKNKDQSAYVGRCPKCMRTLRVPIGKEGTGQRFFDAY